MVKIELTEDEVLALDGKVNPEAQGVVETVKRLQAARTEITLSREYADYITVAIENALKEGKISVSSTNMTKCQLCGAGGGYYTHSRTTRYHRKGTPDYDKPILVYGVDLARSFVKNYPRHGCCTKCWQQIKPVLAERLKSHRVEVDEDISGTKPVWIKCENQKCEKCGWTGHEGQLGKLRTLMNDGYYPGKCPQCGAENHLFNHPIKTVDGFQVVAAADCTKP